MAVCRQVSSFLETSHFDKDLFKHIYGKATKLVKNVSSVDIFNFNWVKKTTYFITGFHDTDNFSNSKSMNSILSQIEVTDDWVPANPPSVLKQEVNA